MIIAYLFEPVRRAKKWFPSAIFVEVLVFRS